MANNNQLSNYIYDHIFYNYIEWPYTCSRFGNIIEEAKHYTRQQLIFSCRTDAEYNYNEGSWNKLGSFFILASFDSPNENRYFKEEMENLYSCNTHTKKNSFIQNTHILIHPGEIYSLEVSPKDRKWIATSADLNDIFIWNTLKHKPNFHQFQRREKYVSENPEIVLQGHDDITLYPLTWSNDNFRLAAGSRNGNLAIWDLEDHQQKLSSLLMSGSKREGYGGTINGGDSSNPPKLSPKNFISASTKPIEDLVFHPQDQNIIATVSEDKTMKVWDFRMANHSLVANYTSANNTNVSTQIKLPIFSYEATDELLSIDWNKLDPNQMMCGSMAGDVSFFDIRNITDFVNIKKHRFGKSAVRSIKYSNFNKNIFGVGCDNLNFCELEGDQIKYKFIHKGNKSPIIDFDWNHKVDWSISAISENQENDYSSGGILQIFKPLDVFCLSEQEAIQKIAETQ